MFDAVNRVEGSMSVGNRVSFKSERSKCVVRGHVNAMTVTRLPVQHNSLSLVVTLVNVYNPLLQSALVVV